MLVRYVTIVHFLSVFFCTENMSSIIHYNFMLYLLDLIVECIK